ncbi:unnamed protein product [Prorocentrum cordatum]|uniref:Peptidase C14 caspase domain-containing protein n=1 Tax=Prorocentrum cordatum TaxID=2364126 RepID=A0ABN9XWD1_9DINO|nr:unnamed protein product [Polarella glacialis]
MIDAEPAACCNGCGFAAYGTHPHCCTRCRGPDGPHAKDCPQKNKRLRPACANGCGRPAFGKFKTCCSHCKGPGTSHARDCEDKCRQAAAAGAAPPAAPAAPHPAAPAALHPATASPTVPAQLKGQCGTCKRPLLVSVPPGTRPGVYLTTHCSGCGTANMLAVPGAGAAAAGGYPAPSSAPAPALPTGSVSGTLQCSCGRCGHAFSVRAPAAKPGSKIGARCPKCDSAVEVRVPGISAPGGTIAHSGRKRALLVGINYFGTRAELKGCINDVRAIADLLQKTLGWDSANIRTLTDDDRNQMPTRERVEQELKWLVQGAGPGDALFFHFSGHGAQQEDPNGFEEDGMNETILPVDFQKAGMLTDDRISDIIVKPLPEGARLTAIMDCCHSGTGLDLPFSYERPGGRELWKEETRGNQPFLPRSRRSAVQWVRR